MKYTTASTFAFLFGALVVVACGGSEAPPGADEGTGNGDGNGSLDGGTVDPGNDDQSQTKQCVSSCTADSQCASSCPETEGATQCCDLATKTCFPTKAAACPKTDMDAGPMVPQY